MWQPHNPLPMQGMCTCMPWIWCDIYPKKKMSGNRNVHPPVLNFLQCTVWFCKCEVEFLSIFESAGFIFCFNNSFKICALSITYFTFREKKARSWFGTRATWESTRCRSSQRRRGNSFKFLVDLNIQMIPPVQSGRFVCHTARQLSYPTNVFILKKILEH